MNPFSSRCCQHNHTHGWPYYIGNLWTATPDGGLAATLYGASKVTAKVGSDEGVEVTVVETTNYPFDDFVRLTVSLPEGVDEVSFPLYIRVPKWSGQVSMTLNGETVAAAADAEPQKWIRVERDWKNGDEVVAGFPSTASFRKRDQNKGCVSIDYGPLTYSLKIKENYVVKDGRKNAMGDSGWQEGAKQEDWPSFDILPGSDWNFGLVDPATLDLSKIELIKRDWPKKLPWTTDAVPIRSSSKAKRFLRGKLTNLVFARPCPQSLMTTNRSGTEPFRWAPRA